MSRIRILPEAVANKIAAGEVVERPASVVKELLENALDAGAKTIRVETEVGGKRMIRVIDDGHGMIHDDALLAFERHATSKLKSADDLLSISTLGFRGEALPTIAAVSRLLLETRDESEAEGTRLEFAGGKLVNVKPAGLPAGTTISVADLFYCVPARKKFLKSDTTELGHIASLVTHYALANPDKHFVLTTPTQEIINCPPAEKLADRIYQLFGRQSMEELVEIPPTSAAFRAAITEPELEPGEESATLTVRGFTSRPDVQRPNRNGIYIFVNRRLVRDRLILARHSRSLSQHSPAHGFSRHAAVPRNALRRSRRQRASRKNRSAFPPLAIRPRFCARLDSPSSHERSPRSELRRRSRKRPRHRTVRASHANILDSGSAAAAASGVPRAIIPTMEEIGVGSGVGSDGGFDLTSDALRPVEQRFAFPAGIELPIESGTAFAAASAAPALCRFELGWKSRCAERERARHASSARPNRGPEASRASQFELYCCGER